MAINDVWQNVGIQQYVNMPNMPMIAIDVAKRLRNRPAMPTRQRVVPIAYNPTESARIPIIKDAMMKQDISKSVAASVGGDGLARAWDLAQKWEGGYSNDPDDRGGETNFGIAANFNPGVDVKKLTKQDAMDIYNRNYYQKSGADRMSPAVGLYLADAAFNQGLGGMTSIMKKAIGTSDIDAMNAMDQREVLEKLHNARMARYRSHPKWNKYGRGWTNRANDGLARAMALLGG